MFHHPGNRRYRHVIALNLRRYKEAKTRLDKMVLIRQVTEQVLDNGRVKFLRKDGKSGEWIEVPFRTAQDKVSHALRDGINKPVFTPLMVDTSTSVEGNKPSASGETMDHPALHRDVHTTLDMRDTAASSLPVARVRLEEPQRSRIAEELRNLNAHRFSPAVRLDSMAAATATTRAALVNLSMMSGLPHSRSASAPNLHHEHRPMLTAQLPHLPVGFESRRASAPTQKQRLPPPVPNQQRFVPPPIGVSSARPMVGGYQNARVPLGHQPQKRLGHTSYMELLALKERTQLANQLAETAISRQMLQQVQQQATTKSFLDGVVQQYARAAHATDQPLLPRQQQLARPLSRDGSVSTNDTV